MSWLSFINADTDEPELVNLDNVECIGVAHGKRVKDMGAREYSDPPIDPGVIRIDYKSGRTARVRATLQDLKLHIPAAIIEAPS